MQLVLHRQRCRTLDPQQQDLIIVAFRLGNLPCGGEQETERWDPSRLVLPAIVGEHDRALEVHTVYPAHAYSP